MEGESTGIKKKKHDRTSTSEVSTSTATFLSEDDYKLVFENSAVAITVANKQEKIIMWNRLAEEITGLTGTQLYLKPVRELYPEQEWKRIRRENIRKKGINHHFETRLLTGKGKIIDVDLSISAIKGTDGVVNGSIGIIKNNSERRKSLQALQISENRYRTLFETMAQGVIYYNSIGEFITGNPAAENILGRSLAEKPSLFIAK